MPLVKGWPAVVGTHNADVFGKIFAGFVYRDVLGNVRSGLTLPLLNEQMIFFGSGMGVSARAFNAVAVRDNRPVFIENDGLVTNAWVLGAAPGANSRIDVLFIKQNDSSALVTTPDATIDTVFGVLQGVAAAAPVRNPAGLPPGALEIGTVLIPTGSATLGAVGVIFTQTYQYTAAEGLPITVRSIAERPTTPAQGDQVYRIDLGCEETYYNLYNVTTNPGGATPAGWYPSPSSDVFFKIRKTGTGIVPGASTTANLLLTVLFGSPPEANVSMPLVGSIYENAFFKWDRSTGVVQVKIEGRYDIQGFASHENTVSVNQNQITKNSATLGTTSLAEDTFLANASSGQMGRCIATNMLLLTTDLIRFLSLISVNHVIGFGAHLESTSFLLRYVGPNK